LRRALGDHAVGIADDVVDTGGDAHASAAYRRQLIAGLDSRHVARAYLKSVRSTRVGESR
jgi:carbon-monoxide dehydrogenase medium subunit